MHMCILVSSIYTHVFISHLSRYVHIYKLLPTASKVARSLNIQALVCKYHFSLVKIKVGKNAT